MQTTNKRFLPSWRVLELVHPVRANGVAPVMVYSSFTGGMHQYVWVGYCIHQLIVGFLIPKDSNLTLTGACNQRTVPNITKTFKVESSSESQWLQPMLVYSSFTGGLHQYVWVGYYIHQLIVGFLIPKDLGEVNLANHVFYIVILIFGGAS